MVFPPTDVHTLERYSMMEPAMTARRRKGGQMFNREALGILHGKVPALKSPWGILLTKLYTAFLVFLCGLFSTTGC